ncbi:MAG: hypothetical protein ACM3JG_14795 [Thiohalocapsa sp.]
MMNPLSPQRRLPFRELLRRIDRIAGELNVVLLVIAIGLGALDFTFLVTQKVVETLPPVTHLSYAELSQPDK